MKMTFPVQINDSFEGLRKNVKWRLTYGILFFVTLILVFLPSQALIFLSIEISKFWRGVISLIMISSGVAFFAFFIRDAWELYWFKKNYRRMLSELSLEEKQFIHKMIDNGGSILCELHDPVCGRLERLSLILRTSNVGVMALFPYMIHPMVITLLRDLKINKEFYSGLKLSGG